MKPIIVNITKGSPAFGRRIFPGDRLLSVNGHRINDVLDYKYYSYEPTLLLELMGQDGKLRLVKIKKGEGEDPGIEFESYLMDNARRCANKCIFCFVDQLPTGMRETLYFKDDDARLSFLQGNYITLTNLSERELDRIIHLHISPINVSVHASEPELRAMMLGNKNGGRGIEIMKKLQNAGIVMNCQIVCCPDINDGEHLMRTMESLASMYPEVASVSVVPVGLTKHRQGLYPIKPFDKERAEQTIDLVESFGEKCFDKFGSKIFFCADEFYLYAGRELPDEDWYEGYPQIENGVGLLRSLITEFEEADFPETADGVPFTAVTGVSAAPFISDLLERAKEKNPKITGKVVPIINDFFGHTINVAGLVTGGDILSQLMGKDIGKRLLIPRNMLRHGEGVFLDDVTIDELEEKLGVTVRIVEQDGGDLAKAFCGK